MQVDIEKATNVSYVQGEDDLDEEIELASPLKVGEERELGNTGIKKKLLKNGTHWETPEFGDEVTVNAFGEKGKDATDGFPSIPPNSVLDIELELASFKPVIDVTGDSKVFKKSLKEGESALQNTLRQLKVESNKRDAKLFTNMFGRMSKDSSMPMKKLKVEKAEHEKKIKEAVAMETECVGEASTRC